MTTTYVPSALPRERELPTAGDAVSHTLLNCLLREAAGPGGWAELSGDRLLLRLPHDGTRLRVAVRRPSVLGAHRFTGPVSRYAAGRWSPIAWDVLAAHVHAALTAQTGVPNDEFLAQVAASHAGVAAALALPRPAAGSGPYGRYLASERSLVFGHRFHPAPKARDSGGGSGGWAAYAPEAGAAFPVRLLAVREELVVEEQAEPGAAAPLDALGQAPAGYRLLPVHPWQYALLGRGPVLREALRRGDVRDLGVSGERFAATASVRTLHGRGGFLKCSLNVRITNCLRKNARYELYGAVALTRLLGPAAAELAARFPGHAVLREPAFRSAALPGPGGAPDLELLEGLGVIVREGLAAVTPPGATALLAAAVADEHLTGPAHISRLLPPDPDPAAVLRWWRAYLGLLVPPVLAAYTDHGLVLEPHLQNVLVCVGGDGLPVAVLFRDLEGAKLLREHHAAALDALPPDVAGPLAYDGEQGWTRLVYCLLVNNVGDMLAALADACPAAGPRLERALWSAVRDTLAAHAAAHGTHPRLAALLAGAPLPAKANLLTRWHRTPDRTAEYVHLPSPLGPDPADGSAQLPWPAAPHPTPPNPPPSAPEQAVTPADPRATPGPPTPGNGGAPW